ncbi:hypothetical protein ARMSODRAFT_960531 [Armillaria solidipes]|uniref:Uncharacterized protein n=1 Tax=Armillaria solidipes TaxID=1076256 RepID=A0A2H3BQD4_9AGAR|nr:hypothetical protein ARMSODRAFT_960531 [Armillaria solidipes]
MAIGAEHTRISNHEGWSLRGGEITKDKSFEEQSDSVSAWIFFNFAAEQCGSA